MRARLRDALETNLSQTVRRPGFLVYLMGAYRTWHPDELVDEGADVDPEVFRGPFGQWDNDEGDYTEDEALRFMQDIRDRLRTGPEGVNAFLAIDPDIPLSEMDAATQSIEFSKAANVTAIVVPYVGRNLGVGIEIGSVLESPGFDTERAVIVHEKGVRSTMLQSLARRWEATVYSFENVDELDFHLRKFIARTMHYELDDGYDFEPR